jgi:NADH:ubiquinone oxidoreductase subunit 3 (subunit A)
MDLILSPVFAFLAYIPLVLVIVGLGRLLAGRTVVTAAKTSVYGSGEASPTFAAAPGYQPFFLIALFFAVVHLAMLVLGVGSLPVPAAIYLGGLFVALIALILG